MSLQLVGIISVVLGLLSLYRPPSFAVVLLLCSTLFGTAAAVNLPALGGASIIIANFFAAFLALRLALWGGASVFLEPLFKSRAGIWLLLLVIYAISSAFLFPRLFAGVTSTVSVTESSTGLRVIQFIPLFPRSGNITQSVYFLGGVAVFCCVVAYLRRSHRYDVLLTGLILAAWLHIAATFVDLFTFYSGTAEILAPVRNANYTMHCAWEMGGLKRLCGLFSEASSFATYTIMLFAVFLNLWIDKVKTAVTGTITIFLFVGLVFSTSGAGYVSLALFLAVLAVGRGLHVIDTLPFRRPGQLVIISAGGLIAAILIVALVPQVSMALDSFLEETVFGKLESDSGRERGLWNSIALQNFYDTGMLGAGLGSARASSLALIFLSNVGIPGALFFALHIWAVLFGRLEPTTSPPVRALVAAARWSVIAHLLAAALIKGEFAFPLFFHICAGIAVAATVPIGGRPGVAAGGFRRRRTPAFTQVIK